MRCNDWLHRIQPSIHDLAPKAYLWWKYVTKEAKEAYDRWCAAGPLERASERGEPSEFLRGEKFVRLESRTLAMLSKASAYHLRTCTFMPQHVLRWTDLPYPENLPARGPERTIGAPERPYYFRCSVYCVGRCVLHPILVQAFGTCQEHVSVDSRLLTTHRRVG